MKHFFVFLSAILILAAVVMDRSGMGWPLEQPLIAYLAKVTHRILPSVTPLLLPESHGLLAPQDVALTLRAVVSFHPRLILVAEPLGDLSSGPLSLIKEALTTGFIQGIPLVFAAIPEKAKQAEKERGFTWLHVPVILFPEETSKSVLPSIAGREGPFSPFGFILPQKEEKAQRLPLLARTSDGSIVSSLWWRGLFFAVESPEALKDPALFFLLGGRFLHLPNHHFLLLEPGAFLKGGKYSTMKALSFDDLLLHREEMERGDIRPDMDRLFRNQTVVIGGPHVAEQSAILEEVQKQLSIHYLSSAFYGGLLLLLTLGMMVVARLAWIDFLLMLVFFLLSYVGLGFFLFKTYGILLPLFLPLAISMLPTSLHFCKMK
ncbi:MAG: hypothetical protein A3F67_01755 [Verrucomicrobia bacterium RIFCSPHIGHO2_12_FULL_41_10]|nr:MAG: hypothetical protein A3F67_01755 [Verrucomicrobia bacterium RIFCSPHIGHO2_12_FULL_41_10]HLB33577.1 hypothetical protein [Chthoniobacterales bacterium]